MQYRVAPPPPPFVLSPRITLYAKLTRRVTQMRVEDRTSKKTCTCLKPAKSATMGMSINMGVEN